MSDAKVIMFPEAGNVGGNNNGFDPNLLLALTQNGGLNGGNGIWVLFLLILFGWRGNCFGNNNCDGTGFLSNQINNTAGRDLLMQAINNNGANLSTLASSLNCDVNSINIAIQSRSKSTKISTIIINSLHQKVTTSSIVNLIRKETSSFIIIIAKAITAPTKKNK